MHIVEGQNLPPTAMREIEALALERWARDAVVLECGAEYGFSTVTMARVAKRVYSVDWHQGYTEAHIGSRAQTGIQYLYNIREVQDKVVPIVGRFEDVLPLLQDKSFDFIFMDGGHDLDGTVFLFKQAARLVKPTGMVACHDYGHPLCSEEVVAREIMGWTPRSPVIDTVALFGPAERNP